MQQWAIAVGIATLLFILVSGIMLALTRRGIDPIAFIGRTLSPGTAGENEAETILGAA